MDIGGGSGAYCIAAAKEHAGIRAVVLDLPVVCEVAREFIAENGVGDRVEAQAVRLHARSVPDRLRCRHHGFQPAHVQP